MVYRLVSESSNGSIVHVRMSTLIGTNDNYWCVRCTRYGFQTCIYFESLNLKWVWEKLFDISSCWFSSSTVQRVPLPTHSPLTPHSLPTPPPPPTHNFNQAYRPDWWYHKAMLGGKQWDTHTYIMMAHRCIHAYQGANCLGGQFHAAAEPAILF